MAYELEKTELGQMIGASREARTEHLITKGIETGEIWTLAADNDLLVLGTEEREQFVVLFPHPDYAMAWFQESGLEEADLVAMDLENWVGGNLEELQEAGVEICVFPTPIDDGTYLSGQELLARFKVVEELS